MHGQAYRPCLVHDRPLNGLLYPPRRVRAELKTFLILKLLDRSDETEIAFFDNVGKLQAAVDILLPDSDDKPQVRLDHPDSDDKPQVRLDHPGAGILISLGDLFCERLFLLKSEKRRFPDFLQIILDGVKAALRGGVILRTYPLRLFFFFTFLSIGFSTHDVIN